MAKNYGGSGNNSLEDLIAYYQKLQPNLNADDVRSGYAEWDNPKTFKNPFARDSVYRANEAPARTVAENVSRDYDKMLIPDIDPGTPEEDEYQKRLKAMQWMMRSESLNANGYIPQMNSTDTNAFPFGMLNNLFNPTDTGKARLEALTRLARDK
jgi:hypothetical protein